jgi:hypothetical protein
MRTTNTKHLYELLDRMEKSGAKMTMQARLMKAVLLVKLIKERLCPPPQ